MSIVDFLAPEQKFYRAADSKKKKSTFRITSIIDPVKNDDEDEDKTEDAEENEG